MNGIRKQNADSTYSLRISLTRCGFRLQLRSPQQLNLTIQMFYYLFVDSTNYSGFRKYGCGFRKIAYFRNDFERYSVLGICLWNPKQRRRSKKSSKVADSATNLILACCGIRLQCTECTVWLCIYPKKLRYRKKLNLHEFLNPIVGYCQGTLRGFKSSIQVRTLKYFWFS